MSTRAPAPPSPPRVLAVVAAGLRVDALIAGLGECNLRGEAIGRDSAGVETILRHAPEAVLVDLTAPREVALRISRRLRGDPRAALLPILCFNADIRGGDMAAALGAGADDCLPCYLSPREIGERIVAVLRRRGILPEAEDVCVGSLVVSPSRHRAFVNGRPVPDLTYLEFRTLLALAARAGHVLTREQILVATHGEESRISERSVDVQIVGLRRKLGPDAPAIESVRGVGYRMAEATDARRCP